MRKLLRKEERPRDVIAIFCADLHLSHKPTLARSNEDDWYGVMEGCLKQLTDLRNTHSSLEGPPPIICSGDILDKWNAPAELINFAIANLPDMYAVPGQHDLPYHNYEDIAKSAYWTLVQVGRITNLRPGVPLGVGSLCLHGFPFGFEPKSLEKKLAPWMDVAVVHKFIWTKSTGYVGAPEENRLKSQLKNLQGYDVAVFGDNHKGFISSSMEEGRTDVINCGGFMRRKSDEADYKPSVGLLYSDGSIERHYLDTSKDKMLAGKEALSEAVQGIGFEGFLEELSTLGRSAIDFTEAVKQTLQREKIPDSVRDIVLQVMDCDRKDKV